MTVTVPGESHCRLLGQRVPGAGPPGGGRSRAAARAWTRESLDHDQAAGRRPAAGGGRLEARANGRRRSAGGPPRPSAAGPGLPAGYRSTRGAVRLACAGLGSDSDPEDPSWARTRDPGPARLKAVTGPWGLGLVYWQRGLAPGPAPALTPRLRLPRAPGSCCLDCCSGPRPAPPGCCCNQ